MSNWDITYEWSEKKKTTKIFHDKEAETVPRILGTSEHARLGRLAQRST